MWMGETTLKPGETGCWLAGFEGRANEHGMTLYPLTNEQTSKMEVSNHEPVGIYREVIPGFLQAVQDFVHPL